MPTVMTLRLLSTFLSATSPTTTTISAGPPGVYSLVLHRPSSIPPPDRAYYLPCTTLTPSLRLVYTPSLLLARHRLHLPGIARPNIKHDPLCHRRPTTPPPPSPTPIGPLLDRRHPPKPTAVSTCIPIPIPLGLQ